MVNGKAVRLSLNESEVLVFDACDATCCGANC